MPFSRPSADLVVLASTNKRLREVLREKVFRCLEVGELREGLECSESYQEEVEWLASDEGEGVVRCVRCVEVHFFDGLARRGLMPGRAGRCGSLRSF